MLPSCSVHGVILDGGSKANVIPERSELFYFVRGADDKSRDDLWDKVVSCAKAAGEATGRFALLTSFADISSYHRIPHGRNSTSI